MENVEEDHFGEYNAQIERDEDDGTIWIVFSIYVQGYYYGHERKIRFDRGMIEDMLDTIEYWEKGGD